MPAPPTGIPLSVQQQKDRVVVRRRKPVDRPAPAVIKMYFGGPDIFGVFVNLKMEAVWVGFKRMETVVKGLFSLLCEGTRIRVRLS